MTVAGWTRSVWAVCEKDIRIELRTRYAFNALLMFVLGSLLLILFALGQSPVSEQVEAALLWIVILFAAAVGLGRAFVAEEDGGTTMLLQVNARGTTVLVGKLLFNLMVILMLSFLAAAAFVFALGITIQKFALLLVTVVLGAVGLAGSTTLLAAIIARTSNRSTLLPVLLFPVLIPLLLAGVGATRLALIGGAWSDAADELLTLVGYAGVVVTASVLLFDFVWQE